MGRGGNVCVLCVKALRRAKPFCWTGELECSAALGMEGGAGAVLVWRLPCGTAAWWGHWCGTTTPQQPQPGGIVVTHQTLTQLSFRLQGRYSWCFQISLLFIVRNHKALLTLFREVEMEKGGLFTVPVTANKHPGIIRVASACPKLKTHKKCRFMLLSACPFPANLWFRS